MPHQERPTLSTHDELLGSLPVVSAEPGVGDSQRRRPAGWLQSLAGRAWVALRRTSSPATAGSLLVEYPLHGDDGELLSGYFDDTLCELPVDEEVRLRSIWITEAYAPSRVPALVHALGQLGLDVPNQYGAHGLSPSKLREARSGRGFSFHSLGTLAAAGRYNDLMGYRTVELPAGFERAHVSAHHPILSTTVLVFQFVLDYEASLELTALFPREDPALKDDFNARMQRAGPGRRAMAAATRTVRERHRRACAEWVSSQVPGLFTAWGGVPAAELITLEKADPLTNAVGYHPTYVEALGLNQSFYASELWGRQGLRLGWPFSYGSSGDLVLSGRVDELCELESPDERGTMLSCVHAQVREPLVLWALYESIRRSADEIAVLRDRVAELSSREPADAVRALGAVQREFMRLVVDTVPMEREVRELCEDPERYHRDSCGEFKLIGVHASAPDADAHVFEHVRKRTAEEAARLSRTSRDLRDMITTTSSILNSLAQERATAENLRLQRQVFWMGIVFGALAAILSVLQIVG